VWNNRCTLEEVLELYAIPKVRVRVRFRGQGQVTVRAKVWVMIRLNYLYHLYG